MSNNTILFTPDALKNHPEAIFTLALAASSILVAVVTFAYFMWYFADKKFNGGRVWAVTSLVCSILSTLTQSLQNLTPYSYVFATINNFFTNLMFLFLSFVNIEFQLIFGQILTKKRYITSKNVRNYHTATLVLHIIFCGPNYIGSFFHAPEFFGLLQSIGIMVFYSLVVLWTISLFTVLLRRIRDNQIAINNRNKADIEKNTKYLLWCVAAILCLTITAGISFITANVAFGTDEDSMISVNSCVIISESLFNIQFSIIVFLMEATISLQLGGSSKRGSMLSERRTSRIERQHSTKPNIRSSAN